jgi:F-type H+-transporting ATPase subunit b
VEAILPQWPEVLVAAISFGVLFFVLWKFAFPPITNMLAERAERIKESLEKAEETRMEAEALLEDYRKQMAEARADAGRVVEQSRTVAEGMKDEIIAKANEEAEAIKAKAVDAIEAEKRAAVAELQASVADLSVAIAGKIIEESLSKEEHEALIEKYLAEVGNLDEL